MYNASDLRGLMRTPKTIPEILEAIDLPVDNPQFFSRAFTVMCKERQAIQARDGDNLKRVCLEEYGELSRRIDRTGVQESCAVRNVLRTRRFANLLISDKGELNRAVLEKLIFHCTSALYSLGPDRQYDSMRQEHILKVLISLRDNAEVMRLIKQISRPFSNPLAEQIIRETLFLPPNLPISDAHTKRAVLSALLCTLRQNVGSCFATAPAIITHDEQPELFLIDLNELLATGRLKRTFGGVEYAVPLSVSWGSGGLRKPIALYFDSAEGQIWTAPGLILALEAGELIQKDIPLKEKNELAKAFILKAFPAWREHNPFIVTSISEILQRILLNHCQITLQDLEAFEARPKGMIHSGLLMQLAPVSNLKGGKGDACSRYILLLERMTSAFKGLADNALLKAWEYTIASFAETKSEFTRWNLYASLGLGPQDPGGIGACLYEILKVKLEECNQQAKDLQFEYTHVYEHVKQLETRLKMASSEKEAQWVRVEYQSRANEFYTLEQMRNQAQAKAELFADLFNHLIDQYDKLFPKYFQEVYDPDLQEARTGIFDDSPAGFRLVYKHGRAHSAQWTRVKTPQEFIDVLANFFMTTETELVSVEIFEGVQKDLSEIITAVVNHIRTPEFLETAFYRMAAAHQTTPIKNPLENLDRIPMKPWAYISGGTMNTLVCCYHRREQKLTEISRWVESPMELLVFMIDILKQSPHKAMEEFIALPNKSMLIHSPTHAFLLKPGLSPLKEAWLSNDFTYTWVRDNFVKAMESFLDSIRLEDEMQMSLIDQLAESLSAHYKHYFKKIFANLHGVMTPMDFRAYIIDKMDHERGLQYEGANVLSSEQIDSVLYQALPFFPRNQLEERLKKIWSSLSRLPDPIHQRLLGSLESLNFSYGKRILSSQNLYDICTSLVCIALGTTSSPIDFQADITQTMQKLGYAMPAPIIFADTNWTKDMFGFVVNPGTANLDLWRVDFSGRKGAPMSDWHQWLNGSRKDLLWGLYPNVYEYTSDIFLNRDRKDRIFM